MQSHVYVNKVFYVETCEICYVIVGASCSYYLQRNVYHVDHLK